MEVKRMKAATMWKEFKKECPEINCDYEAWAFGEDANNLAKLVLQGKKTATSSLYDAYKDEREPLPQVGEYSVLLLDNEEAVCILRNIKVSVMPFSEVGEDHARKEGEGDLSLDYWRKVHKDFFEKQMLELGKVFSPRCNVVCEEFEIVYPSIFVKKTLKK